MGTWRRSSRGKALILLAAMAWMVPWGCSESAEQPALLPGGGPSGAELRFERIILIVVDTLRADHVGVYGSEIPTPRIDGLARNGTIFRNAIANFHSTTMSMAALFSGRTPSIESGDREKTLEWNTFASCGLARFSTPGFDDDCVPREMEMLAEALRSAGYWTMGVTSNKLLYRPYGYDQGFDDWVEVGEEIKGGRSGRRRAGRQGAHRGFRERAGRGGAGAAPQRPLLPLRALHRRPRLAAAPQELCQRACGISIPCSE